MESGGWRRTCEKRFEEVARGDEASREDKGVTAVRGFATGKSGEGESADPEWREGREEEEPGSRWQGSANVLTKRMRLSRAFFPSGKDLLDSSDARYAEKCKDGFEKEGEGERQGRRASLKRGREEEEKEEGRQSVHAVHLRDAPLECPFLGTLCKTGDLTAGPPGI